MTRHRLAAGFPAEVTVAAKSGSLLGIVRNEIGVVEYPDGDRYAVAIFTRAAEPFRNENEINAATAPMGYCSSPTPPATASSSSAVVIRPEIPAPEAEQPH